MVSGAVAARHIVGMQHPPDEAGEVVAVQVGDEDRRDAIGIEAKPLHPDERGGAAVDEKLLTRRRDVEASLQTATRPEGVAGADDGQPHNPLGQRGDDRRGALPAARGLGALPDGRGPGWLRNGGPVCDDAHRGWVDCNAEP